MSPHSPTQALYSVVELCPGQGTGLALCVHMGELVTVHVRECVHESTRVCDYVCDIALSGHTYSVECMAVPVGCMWHT